MNSKLYIVYTFAYLPDSLWQQLQQRRHPRALQNCVPVAGRVEGHFAEDGQREVEESRVARGPQQCHQIGHTASCHERCLAVVAVSDVTQNPTALLLDLHTGSKRRHDQTL